MGVLSILVVKTIIKGPNLRFVDSMGTLNEKECLFISNSL